MFDTEILPLLTNINPAAPIRPIIIPKTAFRLAFSLKKVTAKTKVKSGVIEFKIPFSELSMDCWALINKKYGIALPINAEINNTNPILKLILVMPFIPKGVKNKNTIKILYKVISTGLYVINPFFIKMKELPHIRAKKQSVIN